MKETTPALGGLPLGGRSDAIRQSVTHRNSS